MVACKKYLTLIERNYLMHKKLPQSSAFKLFLISGMIIYQELQEPNFSGVMLENQQLTRDQKKVKMH